MNPQKPRLVMIGNSNVGKTSLVLQICEDQWKSESRATVAAAFYVLKGDENQNQTDVQIWDTAGAEKFKALNTVYYHNSLGGILVFDLTNRVSFDALGDWAQEFLDFSSPGALLILVGNKCDLTDKYEVRPDEGEKWAKAHGIKFFTTSAKENINIAELKEYILSSMPQVSTSFLPSVQIGNARESQRTGCCG